MLVRLCMLTAALGGDLATAVGREVTPLSKVAAAVPTGPSLGSQDFLPTPQRPIGWRGDWTGRFPGATPPAQWSRRVKGVTAEIKYQAGKPSGEPGRDSHPLEYFTIKEWLVAGPFAVEDPAKDIDKDFLGGEASVVPATGAPAGNSTWKPLRVGVDTQSCHYHNEGTCGDLNVDFVYVFGNLPASGSVPSLKVPLDRKLAYAHAYFHSPSGGQVMLRVNYAAAAVKVFLNGRTVAIERGQAVKVATRRGWNRLLVKAASGQAAVPEGQNPWVSRWRFAAYLEPVLPVSYETNNVAWMTKMTGRSMSAPIVVGERVYVGSGMTDLLCLDKRTGKVLWLRSNTPYDAMTDAQRAASPKIKEKIEPLVAELKARNEEAVEAINSAVSPTGLSSDEQVKLDKTLMAKAEAERAVHDAFAKIDRKKYPQMYRNEVSSSNAVPLCDGRHVYWVCGGGMKGPGSHVIACFDLGGKRLWSWHDGGSLGSTEHGNHISLNLVDGRLIYAANGTLMALDAATGREQWRNCPDDWQNIGHGSNSPLVVKIGGQSAIVQIRYIHRASDGTVICPSNLDLWGVLTPIVEKGVIFNPCHWCGWKAPVSFIGVKLPSGAGAARRPRPSWTWTERSSRCPSARRAPSSWWPRPCTSTASFIRSKWAADWPPWTPSAERRSTASIWMDTTATPVTRMASPPAPRWRARTSTSPTTQATRTLFGRDRGSRNWAAMSSRTSTLPAWAATRASRNRSTRRPSSRASACTCAAKSTSTVLDANEEKSSPETNWEMARGDTRGGRVGGGDRAGPRCRG